METRCEKCNNGNPKSMKQVLANPDRYHVEQAIKLADTQVGRNGQVLTLPLYMGAFHTANRAVHSLAIETSVL